MNTICRPAGLMHDPRVGRLSNSLHRRFNDLVDLAAGGAVWGLIPAQPLPELAWAMHTTAYLLGRAITALAERGLILEQSDGWWMTSFGDGPGNQNVSAPAPPQAPVAPSRSTTWRQRQRGSVSPDVSQAVSSRPGETPESVSRTVSDPVSPRARVGDINVNVSEDKEIALQSSDSGDVSESGDVNVAARAGETNHPTPETKTAPGETASETPTGQPRRSISFPREAKVRAEDVHAVLLLTNDEKSRGRWVQLWKHCNTHALLHCWDEAYGILVGAISGASPPSNRGAFLNITLCNLLRDAGSPIDQGSAGERAEAASAIDEIRRGWAQDDGSGGDDPPAGAVPA